MIGREKDKSSMLNLGRYFFLLFMFFTSCINSQFHFVGGKKDMNEKKGLDRYSS